MPHNNRPGLYIQGYGRQLIIDRHVLDTGLPSPLLILHVSIEKLLLNEASSQQAVGYHPEYFF